jgi:hypothetical protein
MKCIEWLWRKLFLWWEWDGGEWDGSEWVWQTSGVLRN